MQSFWKLPGIKDVLDVSNKITFYALELDAISDMYSYLASE